MAHEVAAMYKYLPPFTGVPYLPFTSSPIARPTQLLIPPMSNSITFQLHELDDDQMRTLKIVGDLKYIEQVTSGSHGTAPNLQSLEIGGVNLENSNRRFNSSFNFLGNPVPSMQELVFWDVIPLKLITFPNLTTIKWVAPLVTVNFEALLDSLAATPLLEVIMVDVKITPSNDPNTLKKKVTLNELINLRWIDCGGSTSLIPHLVASKLQNLRISVQPLDEKDTTLASILTPDHQNDIGLFQMELVQMYYIHKPAHSNWRLATLAHPDSRLPGRPDHEVDIEIQGDFETDCPLPNLPFSLSNTKIFTVVTEVEKPPLGSIPINQLTNLETLRLGGKTTSLIPLLEPNSSDGSVPFPHLEKVLITINTSDSFHNNLTILRDALQKRNELDCRVGELLIVFPLGLNTTECWQDYVGLIDEVKAKVDVFSVEQHMDDLR